MRKRLGVLVIVVAVLMLGGPVSTASATSCHPTVVRLVDRLSSINSRLADGMTFVAYKTAVTNAKVAYDRIPFRRLSPDCVSLVGVPAEKALNRYITAYNVWRIPVSKGQTLSGKRKKRVQTLWAQADRLVNQAINNLG